MYLFIFWFPYFNCLVLICGANQWTGFYMITAFVMKGLTCYNEHEQPSIKLSLYSFINKLTKTRCFNLCRLDKVVKIMSFLKKFYI